jgi:hypothetical protein
MVGDRRRDVAAARSAPGLIGKFGAHRRDWIKSPFKRRCPRSLITGILAGWWVYLLHRDIETYGPTESEIACISYASIAAV